MCKHIMVNWSRQYNKHTQIILGDICHFQTTGGSQFWLMLFDKDGQERQGWLVVKSKRMKELQGTTNTWVKGTLQ